MNFLPDPVTLFDLNPLDFHALDHPVYFDVKQLQGADHAHRQRQAANGSEHFNRDHQAGFNCRLIQHVSRKKGGFSRDQSGPERIGDQRNPGDLQRPVDMTLAQVDHFGLRAGVEPPAGVLAPGNPIRYRAQIAPVRYQASSERSRVKQTVLKMMIQPNISPAAARHERVNI